MNCIPNKIDVIVLSLVVDDLSHQITKNCIDSYINHGKDLINKIYVVETNSKFDFNYSNDSRIEQIFPEQEFNYNKFFNIALKKCQSEYIAGPNNDLIVEQDCLQKLVTILQKNQKLGSVCPRIKNWHRHSTMYFPQKDKLYHGYETSLHVFGGFMLFRRNTFDIIGPLDERFYFFYQDNDYAMSIMQKGILHGIYTGATLFHISGGSNRIASRKFQYLQENMRHQGEIFANKWGNN